MEGTSGNFIATMPGPLFLVFYAVLIAVTILFCRALVRKSEAFQSAPLPPIPPNPDPYEIAYLRSGGNEAFRVALFNLLQRGYLIVGQAPAPVNAKASAPQQVSQAVNHPDVAFLSPLERALFDGLAAPVAAPGIFTSQAAKRARQLTDGYKQQLVGAGLLTSPHNHLIGYCAAAVCALVLMVAGCYKIGVATHNGHSNIGFLSLMLLASPVLAFVFCRASRVSQRGQLYLKRLQMTFDQNKTQVMMPPVVASGAAAAPGGGSDMILLLALYGVTTLNNTPYAAFVPIISPPVSSGSSGCSSGGCSSGGGGGCGGCGGGS